MKKFFGEFKKFITRGNILDMSVGVIVGGAFTSIVNALSNNILKPIINWVLALILGQDSLSGIYTYLKVTYIVDANGAPTTEIDLVNSIYIDWGEFVNAIINFLLIAFVLFSIVRFINKVSEHNKRMQNKIERAKFKQEKGLRLSKKEVALLEEENARIKAEEAVRLAEEEAKKNAPKPVTSEDLLTEIRDLLKNK